MPNIMKSMLNCGYLGGGGELSPPTDSDSYKCWIYAPPSTANRAAVTKVSLAETDFGYNLTLNFNYIYPNYPRNNDNNSIGWVDLPDGWILRPGYVNYTNIIGTSVRTNDTGYVWSNENIRKANTSNPSVADYYGTATLESIPYRTSIVLQVPIVHI